MWYKTVDTFGEREVQAASVCAADLLRDPATPRAVTLVTPVPGYPSVQKIDLVRKIDLCLKIAFYATQTVCTIGDFFITVGVRRV